MKVVKNAETNKLHSTPKCRKEKCRVVKNAKNDFDAKLIQKLFFKSVQINSRLTSYNN